jgi:alanine racemase
LTPRPPLRLLLDGEALVSNWKWLAKQSGKADCGAAVKANGYGLGAREVVKRLSAAGCRNFFVAHWGEAAAIADIIPPDQIAVLNGLDADDASEVLGIGAIPVLNTPKQIERWKAAGGGRCHIMLDSGINRLGIGPEQLSKGLFDDLDIDILMSHLASADEDVPQNADQLKVYHEMSLGLTAQRRSFANSAGIMLGSDYHFDLTRPGLSLYGGIARAEMVAGIKPVVSVSAHVLQVRDVPAGAAIGYNAKYVADRPMRVATAAIGYADGLLRCFSNGGSVAFNTCELRVIGRVSMDLLLINATDARHLVEGDWVDVGYDLLKTADLTGLSQYELLTGLRQRCERQWK